MKPLLSCLLALLTTSSLLLAAEAPTFPKKSAVKRVKGQLISSDYVHRSGLILAEDGTLLPFSMPPYGMVRMRGTEADLREVPLGSAFTFVLLPDAEGQLTQLVTTEDGHSGPPDADLRNRFIEFTKARGIAGWIDKTQDNLVTLTFFSSDPAEFKKTWADAFAANKSGGKLCVANDELRTWNPPVDGEGVSVTEVHDVSQPDAYGTSGVQIVVRVSNMLEGFRRGRTVRVFAPGWKAGDQFYGESLMGYGFARMQNQELVENVAKEYPEQFPFRTDFGNAHLPWFQVKPGTKLPPFSEHVILAELVKADAAAQKGQYRLPNGTLVDFTLLEKPSFKQLGHDVPFEALSPGQRHRFHTYQDAQGAFTRVSFIADEFSHLQTNVTTARVLQLKPEAGFMDVAWQIPEVKDYNGDMKRPPDIGQTRLLIHADTRVWKLDSQVTLQELKKDDVLLLNFAATPRLCSDLWIGEDTHKQVVEKQRQTFKAGKAPAQK